MPKNMRADEAKALRAAIDFYTELKSGAEATVKAQEIALEGTSLPDNERYQVMRVLFAYLVVDFEAFAEVLNEYYDIASEGLLDDTALTDLDGLIEGLEGLKDQAAGLRDAVNLAPLPLDQDEAEDDEQDEPEAEVPQESDPEPPAEGFRLDWTEDSKGVCVHESGRWFAIDKGTVEGPETWAIQPRFTPAERAEAEKDNGRGSHPTWVAVPREQRPGFAVDYFGDYRSLYGDDSQLFVPNLLGACAAIYELHFDTGDFVAQPPR
jgi:hypothetical protein